MATTTASPYLTQSHTSVALFGSTDKSTIGATPVTENEERTIIYTTYLPF